MDFNPVECMRPPNANGTSKRDVTPHVRITKKGAMVFNKATVAEFGWRGHDGVKIAWDAANKVIGVRVKQEIDDQLTGGWQVYISQKGKVTFNVKPFLKEWGIDEVLPLVAPVQKEGDWVCFALADRYIAPTATTAKATIAA